MSRTKHPRSIGRFRVGVVEKCIREIQREQLSGVQYVSEEIPSLSLSLANSIKNRLKELGFNRYKLVVQVVIGEQRGEGMKETKYLFLPCRMAARCFWDADTDSYAKDIYVNDSLFCVAAAFGIYYY
ncbi:tctex1 domain-containing protein 2 isoform X2 [Electrophorus electricus]|uniref:tctex1 domain-containing protein 2 isoform X2 n=1 Tax=Electrophorus electricus TaxID=8005 RepID=UPI0015CFDF26|nr:tctex1 domain-containing protein 2 isoform X2 [Electrophorus electricus]